MTSNRVERRANRRGTERVRRSSRSTCFRWSAAASASSPLTGALASGGSIIASASRRAQRGANELPLNHSPIPRVHSESQRQPSHVVKWAALSTRIYQTLRRVCSAIGRLNRERVKWSLKYSYSPAKSQCLRIDRLSYWNRELSYADTIFDESHVSQMWHNSPS